MSNKKYQILYDDNKMQKVPYIDEHVKVYRIKALIDFTNILGRKVSTGDLGGFVQSEDSLSHSGKCWIEQEACVFENATVSDDASVEWCALAYGNAKISGKSRLGKEAKAYGNSSISGCAYVGGCSEVYDNAQISGDAELYSYTVICGDAVVKTNHWHSGYADGNWFRI